VRYYFIRVPITTTEKMDATLDAGITQAQIAPAQRVEVVNMSALKDEVFVLVRVE
jgi:hypothetical protein